MSDPTAVEPARLSVATLTTEIAAVVVETAGVVRLEPTLKAALSQMTPSGRTSSTLDGVHVVSRGSTTEVSVDIATRDDLPALASAELVQQRIRDAVLEAGHQPGSVTVSVLAIERGLPLDG